MLKSTSLVLLVIFECGALVLNKPLEKDWLYVIQNFEWNSTDENVIATPLRPVRIARGYYGLSGNLNIGAEIDEKYQIQMKIYHSTSGTSQYKLTPFRVPKTSMYYYMTTFYKKYAMKDVKNCSDMPQFEGVWDIPIPVHNYRLDTCVLSSENMPTHMPLGYYKLVLEVEGPLVHYISETTSKIFENN